MKIAPLIQTLYKGGRANNDSHEEVAEKTLMNGTNKEAYQDETHATSCKDTNKYNGASNTINQNNRLSNIEHQINDLEKQIKTLRQQTQQDQQRQTHIVNNNAVNTMITNQPKNWEHGPSPGGSTTNNEQTITQQKF